MKDELGIGSQESEKDLGLPVIVSVPVRVLSVCPISVLHETASFSRTTTLKHSLYGFQGDFDRGLPC